MHLPSAINHASLGPDHAALPAAGPPSGQETRPMSMEHSTQVELLQRLLGQVERKTSDMAERQFAVPVHEYPSPERAHEEAEALFRRFPLLVGHLSQVASSGDCLTHDALGVPILVVRDRNSGVRAFLNVCRHRGTRLVLDRECQAKKSLVCPYHNW